MEDSKIVALYWARDEEAIRQTPIKYGRYCYAIAYSILHSREEAEECENDTYLDAWRSMPPHKPQLLSAFLGKITRRISLDKWRRSTAEKRGGGEVSLSLSELTDCISDSKIIDENLQADELAKLIDAFLRTLPHAERSVFLCRYWYFDTVADIAKQFGFGQSKVKTMLLRTRRKLKTYLEKEGITI